MVVGLKSWRSCEWSCGSRALASNREEPVYNHDQAVGRAWSSLVELSRGIWAIGTIEFNLIGSVNLALFHGRTRTPDLYRCV